MKILKGLEKKLKKNILNVVTVITVVMIVYGGCVSASAYHTGGLTNQTIENQLSGNYWIKFEGQFTALLGTYVDNFYSCDTRYLFLPNYFHFISTSEGGWDFKLNHSGSIPYTLNSCTLSDDVTIYKRESGEEVDCKYVVLDLDISFPRSAILDSAGGTGYHTDNSKRVYIASLMYDSQHSGSGECYSSGSYPIVRNNAVLGTPQFRDLEDREGLGYFNLFDTYYEDLPVLDSSTNIYTYHCKKLVCEKWMFDAQVNSISASNGITLDVNLSSGDECGCQNCCDCQCGYYSEELKQDLIDYFNTNMVTRQMFEEFVEEQYGSAENFNNDYSELSSLHDDTSYQSQQDENQSNQNEMFSELGSYVDRLDEFESQLTVSPEVQQASLIFNQLFEHFPSAVIVALVFVLVMIVVVKILGR